jgi:NitT/TauT family transport system substrate-binding protein
MRGSGAWGRCARRARGLLLAGLLLSGCGGAAERSSLALNWKPEPEFGGVFEAQRSGAFARHGLDLELTGGPGAPVIQMVESGQATFGIASADEVVLARDRGSDVVAVFATYQTSPQGLMTHAARGVHSLEDLLRAGGTLAVEPGLPYVKFLERRYGFGALQVVPYTYSIAPFLQDRELAQQVFVTSEPIAARRAGADPVVFLVADSGYDPYTAVVIARGARVREQPAQIAALVAALREGWRAYLDDPSAANAEMGRKNPEMDAESFRLAAEAQRPLIETRDAGRPLGSMTRERWATLADQLQGLGLIEKPVDPDACFVPAPGDAGEPRTG